MEDNIKAQSRVVGKKKGENHMDDLGVYGIEYCGSACNEHRHYPTLL